MKIEGLPVVEVDEREEITVAVRADDLLEGDPADPERHPIAIALRRQEDVSIVRKLFALVFMFRWKNFGL
jgi:hypothetical protein